MKSAARGTFHERISVERQNTSRVRLNRTVGGGRGKAIRRMDQIYNSRSRRCVLRQESFSYNVPIHRVFFDYVKMRWIKNGSINVHVWYGSPARLIYRLTRYNYSTPTLVFDCVRFITRSAHILIRYLCDVLVYRTAPYELCT